MKLNKALALCIVAALHAFPVSSSPVSFCPDDSDVCLQWAVPQAGGEPESGDIYFQIEAPISYQWIGLGIGKQMAGASMFLIYDDGNGNVTLSERAGKGHTMPQPVQQESTTLLSGSGVIDNRMVANVRYQSSGDFDISDFNNWIMAKRKGVSMDSTNPDESISIHDSYSAFSIDLSEAIAAYDTNNPFEGTDGDGPASSPPSGGVTEVDSNRNGDLILAHGIILTLVFTGMYPLGAIAMPFLGKWYIHAGWQMVGFLMMWAGFGIGYVVSDRLGIFFNQAHTRLGVFVVALMGIQPILGFLHHLQYRRQLKRGAFGHVHIWYGRIIMVLGLVNGGLGLQLTGGSTVYIIVYSVLASVSALLYISYTVFRLLRNKA